MRNKEANKKKIFEAWEVCFFPNLAFLLFAFTDIFFLFVFPLRLSPLWDIFCWGFLWAVHVKRKSLTTAAFLLIIPLAFAATADARIWINHCMLKHFGVSQVEDPQTTKLSRSLWSVSENAFATVWWDLRGLLTTKWHQEVYTELMLSVLGARREKAALKLSVVQGESDRALLGSPLKERIATSGPVPWGGNAETSSPIKQQCDEGLLQVQALLFLTLYGALRSCFAWDSKDSKVSSVQGSQRLNKFKMTCPASLGVIPLCVPFCAEHLFMMRSFIDGIISISREREDWFALTEHQVFLLGCKQKLSSMQRTIEKLKIKLHEIFFFFFFQKIN